MDDYEDILGELCDILKTFAPEGQSIEEDTDLVSDLNLDSMRVMNLVLAVEDHFDISIPISILPTVRTVKDFVLQVQRLIKEGL